jgi:hypothetical protein
MLSTTEGGFSMSVVGLGGSLSQRKFSAIMLNWCDNRSVLEGRRAVFVAQTNVRFVI